MLRTKVNAQVVLKPQDLVILFRLSLDAGPAPPYAVLALELGLTASEIHAALQRAILARLARKEGSGRGARVQLLRDSFARFVQYGAQYAFPATRGEMSRGMPTAHGASPLREKLVGTDEPPPVWPYRYGTTRGPALYPLYPTVPDAVTRNAALGELLVLFDAIRGGSTRERTLALEMLQARLS